MRRFFQIFSNIKSKYYLFFNIIFLAITFQILLDHKLYADDSLFIKTDKNLKQIEFYPKEYENNEFFYFTKCKVYKLNDDMLNYVKKYKSSINNEISTFYNNKCRAFYYINKDWPVFSDKSQYIRQRYDKIYGPAIIQYLSIIKDSDSYDRLLPDNVFKFWDTSLINSVEKNINLETKKTYPFIFGNTYEKDSAINFLSSFYYEVNRGFSCFFFSYLPQLHPSILTNDSDFIVTNLLQRVDREVTYESTKIKWDIAIPIHFKPKSTKLSKRQKDEIYEVFETNIDGIIASFHVYPNRDTNISDSKAYLEKLSKDNEYLNSLVGDSKLITNISIIELGEKPVLTIQHKNNLSATTSSSIAYVFTQSKFIFEINFSINNSDEKISEECFKNNFPLFEKLAKANSINIK